MIYTQTLYSYGNTDVSAMQNAHGLYQRLDDWVAANCVGKATITATYKGTIVTLTGRFDDEDDAFLFRLSWEGVEAFEPAR